MSESTIWGIFAVAYSVSFMIWQNSVSDTLKERAKLYPGRHYMQERRMLSRTAVVWTLGGFASFAAWELELPVILVAPIVSIVVGVTIWRCIQGSKSSQDNL